MVDVAQLVERQIVALEVMGSIPTVHPKGPVVQWIEQGSSKPRIWVRFPAGLQKVKVMIINIIYAVKMPYDIDVLFKAISMYGDIFKGCMNSDGNGLVTGYVLLAFGGTDFSKVYETWCDTFSENVIFTCYKVSEVYAEIGSAEYQWLSGYLGGGCDTNNV